MSNFRVGEHIVCVKRGQWEMAYGSHFNGPDPEFREICKIEAFADTGFLCLLGYPDSEYDPSRFRPLVTKKENLKQRQEIFNRILTEVNGKVDA